MRVLFGEYLSGLVQAPLDAGLLAQGVAMRDAVLGDLLACAARDAQVELSCLVTPQAPLAVLAAASGLVRQIHPAPEVSALDFLREQAIQHDVVWLIAPEFDDILGRLSEAVPASRWLGCDTVSIRLAASKARTTAWLHTAGVLTPQAFDAATAWVVKPDDGVGATDVRRHAQRADAQADLAQRRAAGRASVLEPWVEGPAMSLSLLCAHGRAELLSVNRQVIRIGADGGLAEEGVQAVTPGALAPPELQALAQAVARAMPGLFGLVGMDYVQHADRGPVLIEVNPRVTSAYAGAAQLLQRNLAQAALDLFKARKAGSPPAR